MDIFRRTFLQAVGSAVGLFKLDWLFPPRQPARPNPERVVVDGANRITGNCRLFLSDDISLLGNDFHLTYTQPIWKYDPTRDELVPDELVAEFGHNKAGELLAACRHCSTMQWFAGRPTARLQIGQLIGPTKLVEAFIQRYGDVTKAAGNSLRGEAFSWAVDLDKNPMLEHTVWPFTIMNAVIAQMSCKVSAPGMTIIQGVNLLGSDLILD